MTICKKMGAAVACLVSFGLSANVAANEGHSIASVAQALETSGGLTWYLQATDGAEDNTSALSYTLDLALEAELGDHGEVYVVFEAGDGQGVDPVIGALSGVNYDAFFTELTNNVEGSTNIIALSISQAYYEIEGFMMDDLTISAGKLDIHSYFDDNNYANDETDQFMSPMFTRSADTTYKQLDYYYAPGIIGQYAMSKEVGLTFIVANANASGFNDVTKNLYYVGQLNLMPSFWNYEGNYRFYALSDQRDSAFPTDTSHPASGGVITSFTAISSGNKTTNSAWGMSFDQAVPGQIGLFARYSAQEAGIIENTVKSSWSFGGVISGDRWGHTHDTAGIAYGSVNVNRETAVLSDAGIVNPADEKHTEIFYKRGFSHLFSLTANLQIINNIGGEADANTVLVYGMRGQLNF